MPAHLRSVGPLKRHLSSAGIHRGGELRVRIQSLLHIFQHQLAARPR